jgi:hypothetical protein
MLLCHVLSCCVVLCSCGGASEGKRMQRVIGRGGVTDRGSKDACEREGGNREAISRDTKHMKREREREG